MPEGNESAYARLSARFDKHHQRHQSGTTLTYLTGEQVIGRLNEVLGPGGWDFEIMEHGVHAEADEFWARGRLRAVLDGQPVVREQFGSQKINRSRSTGTPLDIGFDLKGATTDALKKCATMIGVGLYLYDADERAEVEAEQRQSASGGQSQSARQHGAPALATADLVCADCGAALGDVRFKDGTSWAASQLAGYGQRKHGRVLCMDHYRAANDARTAAILAQTGGRS